MRLSLCSNTIICFLLICVVECPVTYRGAYTSVTPGDAAWQEALELLVSKEGTEVECMEELRRDGRLLFGWRETKSFSFLQALADENFQSWAYWQYKG